jgi:hypothetical protein
MICLDLSQPSKVESEFNKWKEVMLRLQKQLISRCDATKQEELRTKLYRHIQFYTNPKNIGDVAVDQPDDDNNDNDDSDNEDDDDSDRDDQKDDVVIQRTNPSSNIGAPIIVVACKVDAFSKHWQAMADAEDHFDKMCSYLRWWCLEYGAASFSFAKGDKGAKEQARRILQYLDHRIFDSKFDRGPNEVVKLSNLSEQFLFIPSGYDSMDNIAITNSDNLEQTPFSTYFPSKAKTEKKQSLKPRMQSQHNTAFLKTVKLYLSSDSAQSKVPQSNGTGAAASGAYNNNYMNDFFAHIMSHDSKSKGPRLPQSNKAFHAKK